MVYQTPKELLAKESSLFLERLASLKKEPALGTYPFLVSGLYENSEWGFVYSEHKNVCLKDEKKSGSISNWKSILVRQGFNSLNCQLFKKLECTKVLINSWRQGVLKIVPNEIMKLLREGFFQNTSRLSARGRKINS